METADQPSLENLQFQVKKSMFSNGRLVKMPKEAMTITEGEVLVQIEKFAYTANNITYALAGDKIGYWQFFPAMGEDADDFGVIPVWGFARVVASKMDEIPVGERLFGYFPPASHLKMTPSGVRSHSFVDGAVHRTNLPAGYNRYQRVTTDKNNDSSLDNVKMLLSPLHMTSYFLWDALQDKEWYDAKQVIILSASSKTSTGLGYALKADKMAPKVIGVTSARNLKMVEGLGLYDQCTTYDKLDEIDSTVASVIVDMSGNAAALSALHTALGDNMKWCVNVGITHWDKAAPNPIEGLNTERSEFFFAPAHIQRRLKEWGPATFEQKTTAFMLETASKTRAWLTFRIVDGLAEMAKLHPTVCDGKILANEGLIVEL
ncbi:MAG: DUF2855 family protein [Bacteroidota bacterium]